MPQRLIGFSTAPTRESREPGSKIPAVYLLLKKMTEKTIPNPNPAPVRTNTVSEN